MASRAARVTLAMAVFVAVGMVFLGPVNAAVSDNTGTQSVTNETVEVSFGDYTDLGGYDVDQSSVTVYGYNESAGNYEVATEGTDYEFRYAGGAIKALNSTLVDSGEQLQVTYDYQASGALATTVITFIPVVFGVLLFVGVAQRTTDYL